ncbi:cysteine protease StiP family protein [Brevibacillus sp. GCM10020057]|uniref:cysteine protease StiP family protein n=1 Tax=Brevibacillus sp. GCM10020057 TaxID=3317327 RepID=UPI00362C07C4
MENTSKPLWTLRIQPPVPMGSYAEEDVTFLLKELGAKMKETSTQDREKNIQSGVHYSEMLPIEYKPTNEYLDLFHKMLKSTAKKVALATGIVGELIKAKRGSNVILASLARAGTPIGILIRRYLKQIHQIEAKHYSISIIRGKGIDENALIYILTNHPDSEIQFVDGWTGKGAITKVLQEAVIQFDHKYGIRLNDDLAVLADPGHCVSTFGTREDFLIPSACLNSTVSGLISRTVHRSDLVGEYDFHGAKFYKEWFEEDVSRIFVDTISKYFKDIEEEAKAAARLHLVIGESAPTWKGFQDIQRIQHDYSICDINMIKPGVGETTRVLLRRVPWQILVDRIDNPNLKHILLLAEDRGVPVIEYPGLSYSCCGIIKPVLGGES